MGNRTWLSLVWTVFGTSIFATAVHAQPESLEVISHWEDGASWAVAVRDTLAFAGSDTSLVILSVADPTQPRELARVGLSSSPHDIVIRGGFAYVGGTNGLILAAIDVSDPTNPILADSVTSDWRLHTGGHVVFRGDSAFVSVHPFDGSSMYDISDPYDLEYSGEFATCANDVALTVRALYVMDCARPLQARVRSWAPFEYGSYEYFDEQGQMSGAEILDNRLYLVGDGFRIYDLVSDTALPILLGSLEEPDNDLDSDLTLANDLVYIAGDGSGLMMVDAADPAAPEIIARFNTPQALDVAVLDSIVYLAAGDEGIYLLRNVAASDTGTEPADTWTEGEAEQGSAISLLESIAPNPVAGSAVVRIGLASPGSVRLAVYDLLGREVAVLVDQIMPAGEHSLTWQPPQIPNGAYVLSAEAGGRRESRLFSLVR